MQENWHRFVYGEYAPESVPHKNSVIRNDHRLWRNFARIENHRPERVRIPSPVKKFSPQFLETASTCNGRVDISDISKFCPPLSLSLSLFFSLQLALGSRILAECRGKSKQKISTNSDREMLPAEKSSERMERNERDEDKIR